MLPHDIYIFGWIVDGVSAAQIGHTVLAAQGITYNDAVITEANRTFAVINIEPRAENNNTTLGCVAVIFGSEPLILESSEVVLRVQGKLIALSVISMLHVFQMFWLHQLVWRLNISTRLMII